MAVDCAQPVGSDVLAGQHHFHARCGFGGGGIDALDQRVGMGGPQHIAVKLAVQVDVIDILALAHQEFRVFRAWHGLSNTELHDFFPVFEVHPLLRRYSRKREAESRGVGAKTVDFARLLAILPAL